MITELFRAIRTQNYRDQPNASRELTGRQASGAIRAVDMRKLNDTAASQLQAESYERLPDATALQAIYVETLHQMETFHVYSVFSFHVTKVSTIAARLTASQDLLEMILSAG